MRKLRAARAGELGLEVTTLPWLAARLAGGFMQPASDNTLLPAIRDALAEDGFADLDTLRASPGMLRAVAAALEDAWRADLDLAARTGSPGLAGLATLDGRVRSLLPEGVLAPPDLRDAALSRIRNAHDRFGNLPRGAESLVPRRPRRSQAAKELDPPR